MKYELKELTAFSVIGLELPLTDLRSQNLERCQLFWPAFNRQLKINGLNQQKGNWTKFTFMERWPASCIIIAGFRSKKMVPVTIWWWGITVRWIESILPMKRFIKKLYHTATEKELSYYVT